ncbi:MAG: class I SAM-dependent methyltransferase [Clostridia bacterium]|nr:class I SAM-dependent methyltransferase [Clostridia bacterium]
MIDRNQLKIEAQALGLSLSKSQLEMFDRYAEMLVETNKQFNLTAIKDPGDIVTKHFTDSLTVFAAADIPDGSKVIDIGTGAGFPGLPMLIYKNSLELTMVDSTGK